MSMSTFTRRRYTPIHTFTMTLTGIDMNREIQRVNRIPMITYMNL